jgi:alkylhydroperoxidase/carboxymuconolactone decarboxylase family protein YurZ
MHYDAKKCLEEFDAAMADIKKVIPSEFKAFVHEKDVLTKSGRIPEKTKWLLVLIASLSEKCPVCLARAVKHCLEAGWSKEEMLEACMVAVLVGGSSVMTYVAMVDKAIADLT